jgi:hypothetical protein
LKPDSPHRLDWGRPRLRLTFDRIFAGISSEGAALDGDVAERSQLGA